jgi:hypothetical protein
MNEQRYLHDEVVDKYPFQNRDKLLNNLLAERQEEQFHLWNIYGEAGLGKSRLLRELRARTRRGSIALLVDLAALPAEPSAKPDALLSALLAEISDHTSHLPVKADFKQRSGMVIATLIELSNQQQVFLLFDTTELHQDDRSFWNWLEEYVARPLITQGSARLIFAGRVPVPFGLPEIRNHIHLEHLDELDQASDARQLVWEALYAGKKEYSDEDLQKSADLVLSLSFGHPGLTEKLAEFLAQKDELDFSPALRLEACDRILLRFISEEVIKSMQETPWGGLLWWVSVLDIFDLDILRTYFGCVHDQLADATDEGSEGLSEQAQDTFREMRQAIQKVKEEKDGFYIKGISDLRLRYAIAWREGVSYRLLGILRDIVRGCFKQLWSEDYRRGLQAAVQTMDALAKLVPDDEQARTAILKSKDNYQNRLSALDE